MAEYIKHFTGTKFDLMRNKICEISTSLEGITGKMENLEARQCASENRIDNLEESNEQVHKKLKDVNQTIDDHEERITNLEENVANNKTEHLEELNILEAGILNCNS